MTRERCHHAEHAPRTVVRGDIGDAQLSRAAEILAASGEPGRIRMLLVLAEGPAFVSQLATTLGIRLAHASQQLAVLRQANLVAAKRRGKQVEYRLVDHHVETLVDMAIAISSRRRL